MDDETGMSDPAVPQVLHFPTPMLREIEREANRRGQTMSDCILEAWVVASLDIGKLRSSTPTATDTLLAGRRAPHKTELPSVVWRDIDRQAWRLDRSKSWILQQAWVAARRTSAS